MRLDVIIWHVGIHIWNVDQYKLEPNYNEYHKVNMQEFTDRNKCILTHYRSS